MGGRVNLFSPTFQGVPGAYTDKRQTVTDTWNTLKKCLFWLKEAERGWKSGATPLSWKSGWKPSTRREFWAQRSSGSFFRFQDMAVWSWFSCAIKFYIVIFRLCSSALYSTWYSRGLTAVGCKGPILLFPLIDYSKGRGEQQGSHKMPLLKLF